MLEVKKTRDGSVTLYNTELNVHYHSVHGALQESSHVFIDNGVKFIAKEKNDKIRILEIGFGTGLNAILTYIIAKEQGFCIKYTGLEPYPLKKDIYLSVTESYSEFLDSKYLSIWNQFSPGQTSVYDVESGIKIAVETCKWEDYCQLQKFDLIFLDAFAYDIQPELWSMDSLRKIHGYLDTNGICVTYAAKGIIKRNFKASGFKVDTLAGPPGKREMIRAIRVN